MSVDNLPARTTQAATNQPTTHTGEAPNPDVLDHAHVRVYRDWRQAASEVAALAAAFTAAAAVGGLATNTLVELSTALAVAAGALVGVLVWLLAETAREGRRWVYAETDEPHNTPAATP